MKNKQTIIAIAMITVIGFSFAACSKVNKVAVIGVTLSNTELYLSVGDSAIVTATVTPANATNKVVEWATGDASVVTVNNGTVTAVGVGTTAIAVATEDGQMTATCAVYVTGTAAPAPASGGRDSRVANTGFEVWIDNYPAGQRDGFIFKTDGTCYVIDDYSATPGLFAVYGAGGTWTTSGNSLITSFGTTSIPYIYAVTSTTLTLTSGGQTSTYTKAVIPLQ